MLLTAYARALAAGGTSLDSPLTANSPTLIDASVRTTVTTDRVLQTVCLYFQLKPIHLRQQNRTGKVARARQILMYILRTRLKIGLAEIAHFIKRKDHTTILHGVQKIQELLIHDTTTQKEVADICQTLGLSTKEE
jgi:chromosomal replication initiator protein